MPSTLPDPTATRRATLGTAMEKLRHRWGLFVGIGVLAMLLGVVALGLVVTATVTTVYIVAIFMVVKGGSEISMGLNSKTWGREILFILAGLFYIVAAAFAFARPMSAAAILTLMLGGALLVAGGMRTWIGAHMHSHARTMVIAGGLVTGLIGLLVIFGWPANSLVILGTLLGVDLVFTGVMWVGFGLRLRAHA